MTRLAAYDVLRGNGVATRAVSDMARQRGFDARDRGLLRRMVATEVRRRGTLQALVRRFARGRPSRELATILRIGFVQMFFMDQIPDHAAVSETVRAGMDALGLSKARYVNGVLRSALRARQEGHSGDPRRDLVGRLLHLDEPTFHDPETHPLLWAEDALSIPAQILKPWVKRLGRDAAFALAESALEEPPLSIRCVRGEREQLVAELAALEVETQPGAHAAILLAPSNATESVLDSSAFTEGRISIQGETALRAAELGAAREGERWLDLCAAPGGKTAVLAGAGAHVTACDLSEGKLERLASTIARLGLSELVETVQIDPDGAAPAGPFDGVLVDAPCSNTGVLAQRPEARWSYGPQRRASLEELQTRLLESACEQVAPGGRLIYSTCSIEPGENERRVRTFLEQHPEFHLAGELRADPAPRDPAGPSDGGYAARLERGSA